MAPVLQFTFDGNLAILALQLVVSFLVVAAGTYVGVSLALQTYFGTDAPALNDRE
ncbi:hypothetical protein ACKVMT_11265 [Halobacteriales archaeon Cl-PHB]